MTTDFWNANWDTVEAVVSSQMARLLQLDGLAMTFDCALAHYNSDYSLDTMFGTNRLEVLVIYMSQEFDWNKSLN